MLAREGAVGAGSGRSRGASYEAWQSGRLHRARWRRLRGGTRPQSVLVDVGFVMQVVVSGPQRREANQRAASHLDYGAGGSGLAQAPDGSAAEPA